MISHLLSLKGFADQEVLLQITLFLLQTRVNSQGILTFVDLTSWWLASLPGISEIQLVVIGLDHIIICKSTAKPAIII